MFRVAFVALFCLQSIFLAHPVAFFPNALTYMTCSNLQHTFPSQPIPTHPCSPVATLNKGDGSLALKVASVWTGIIQFIMAILGTFILKRFPTSFSVGFFLGLVVIVAQQNLVLFSTFHSYAHGTAHANHIFANLALSLFLIYGFFALILGHFRESVVTAQTDSKSDVDDDATYEEMAR